MRRPLTEEEEAFLQEQLAEQGRQRGSVTEGALHAPRGRRRKSPSRRVFFFQRAEFWMAVLLIIPFLLSGLVAFLALRLEGVFGKDLLQGLHSDAITPEVEGVLAGVGAQDLPLLLDLYHARGLIMASIFTFFILAALLLGLVTSLLRRRRARMNLRTEDAHAEESSSAMQATSTTSSSTPDEESHA